MNRQYTYIKGEFTQDMIPDLIHSLEELEPCEELIVFLTSEGGTNHTAEMITILLQNDKFGKVVIVPGGYVYSAAWRFILTCPFEVRLLNSINAMDHKATMYINDMPVVHNLSFGNKVEMFSEQLSDLDTKWYEFCRDVAGYTEKELEMFEDGSDLYFTSGRVKEILNNVKNGIRKIS